MVKVPYMNSKHSQNFDSYFGTEEVFTQVGRSIGVLVVPFGSVMRQKVIQSKEKRAYDLVQFLHD
jgi:hypothetical protein